MYSALLAQFWSGRAVCGRSRAAAAPVVYLFFPQLREEGEIIHLLLGQTGCKSGVEVLGG